MKTYQMNMTISVNDDINEEEVLDKLVQFAEDNDYQIGGGLSEDNSEELPDPKLIDSMCMRWRHDFGLLNDKEKDSLRSKMSQVWEEVVGLGFH